MAVKARRAEPTKTCYRSEQTPGSVMDFMLLLQFMKYSRESDLERTLFIECK